MSLLSFLPGAISGIGKIIEGVSKQRPAGEVIGGALSALAGVPDATQHLTSDAQMTAMKQLPTQTIRDDVVLGGQPRARVKRVPIMPTEVPQKKEIDSLEKLEDKLDKLDDKIDEIIGGIKDEDEQDRLEIEIEEIEELAEEKFPDDEMLQFKDEILKKEAFVNKKRKRKRRRRRRKR